MNLVWTDLAAVWLRGQDDPEAKAHLAHILPPEAKPALPRLFEGDFPTSFVFWYFSFRGETESLSTESRAREAQISLDIE
jgi:hypothetical protein